MAEGPGVHVMMPLGGPRLFVREVRSCWTPVLQSACFWSRASAEERRERRAQLYVVELFPFLESDFAQEKRIEEGLLCRSGR